MLVGCRSEHLERTESRLNYGARIGCGISWLHQEEEERGKSRKQYKNKMTKVLCGVCDCSSDKQHLQHKLNKDHRTRGMNGFPVQNC